MAPSTVHSDNGADLPRFVNDFTPFTVPNERPSTIVKPSCFHLVKRRSVRVLHEFHRSLRGENTDKRESRRRIANFRISTLTANS